MSVDERLRWVQQLQKQYSDRFSVDGWFHNVEGILGFAGERDLIQPGTWFSWFDAAILHGIQDGLALAVERITRSENPAAEKWQAFFDSRDRGGATLYDATSKVLWGDAEQAATDYGTEVVAPDHGTSPNLSEKLILFAGNIYRRDITVRAGGGPVLDPRHPDFTKGAAAAIFETPGQTAGGVRGGGGEDLGTSLMIAELPVAGPFMRRSLATRIGELAAEMNLGEADIARALGTSPRIVLRWLKEGVSPRRDRAERLVQLHAVFECLADTFTSEAAHDWLITPNPMLGHDKPIDLLRVGELRRVLGAIDALADGVFV